MTKTSSITGADIIRRFSEYLAASGQPFANDNMKRSPVVSGRIRANHLMKLVGDGERVNGSLGFNEYVRIIEDDIAKNGEWTPVDIAILILSTQGLTPAEIISKINSKKAKKPRHRGNATDKGKAFVKDVREACKKRSWNTAWNWLLSCAECATVGKFTVDQTENNNVHYSLSSGGNTKSISKETFRDYWQKAIAKN